MNRNADILCKHHAHTSCAHDGYNNETEQKGHGQWVGIFLTGFSSVIFYILSGIVFLTAILSWAFQIAPGAEVLKMLAVAFAVFIVPHIGGWIVDRIAALNAALRGFIKA